MRDKTEASPTDPVNATEIDNGAVPLFPALDGAAAGGVATGAAEAAEVSAAATADDGGGGGTCKTTTMPVYMVTQGVCQVLLRGEGKDFIGGYKVVSTRRKGNFISQDAGNFIHEDGRGGGTSPLASAIAASERKSEEGGAGGGAGGGEHQAHTVYAVRAVTDVQVLVLDATDMRWAVDHDYRLETELHKVGRVVVWWCGRVVVWWCGRVVVWWCGCVVVWSCGRVVVWWCGGVVVWCCGGGGVVVVWWCGKVRVESSCGVDSRRRCCQSCRCCC